jgi:hypothetical protein
MAIARCSFHERELLLLDYHRLKLSGSHGKLLLVRRRQVIFFTSRLSAAACRLLGLVQGA